METSGKNSTPYSSIFIFVGFLVSSSLFLYRPLPPGFLDMIPGYVWMMLLFVGTLLIIVGIILYIVGFVEYFFTSRCSFLLEICEYILLPISAFSLNQIIFKNSENKNWEELIEAFILFGLTILSTMAKIVYLNQTFPSQTQKQILQFENFSRIFRALKMCIVSLVAILFKSNQLEIVIIILNIVDILIVFKSITFISLPLEEVLLFASLNNLLSILVSKIVITHVQVQLLLSELVLCFAFVGFQHPMHFLLQAKLLLKFSQFQIGRNYFQRSHSKSIIALLLSCYCSIFDLSTPTLQLTRTSKSLWSTSSLQKLKNTYQILLKYYLNETNYTNNINPMHQNSKGRNDVDLDLEKLYFQKYGEKKSNYDIVQSRDLFVNLLAFCMGSFEPKDLKIMGWGFHHQFFLTLVPKINTHFLMKVSVYYFQRLSVPEQSIAFSTRNSKLESYLQYYKDSYMMKQAPEQKFMNFQARLSEFKSQIQIICSLEIQIMQVFGNRVSSLDFQGLLSKRQAQKKKIFKLINESFQLGSYMFFQEFTYMYLLFTIIFCKSVNQTSQIIHDKYMKLENKNKLCSNNCTITNIVVCVGLEKQDSNLGEIVIANSYFRKQFGISNSEIEHRHRRITDLILSDSQKTKHLDLMLQSSHFSQNIIEKPPHSSYSCLLKKNLQDKNYNLLAQFCISTHIYHSYKENLRYLCRIQPKNQSLFALETDFIKIMKTRGLSTIQEPVQVKQLGETMKIFRVDNQPELESVACISESGQAVDINSLDLIVSWQDDRNILDDKDKKFKKIEEVLWKRQSYGDKKLILNILMTSLFFIVICISIFSIMIFSSSITHRSSQINKEIQSVVFKTQSLPLHLALMFSIKKQVDTKVISSSFCKPFFPDLSNLVSNDVQFWTNVEVNSYFEEFSGQEIKIIPVFDKSSWSQISNFGSQYSSFLYTVNSISLEFLSSDISKLKSDDLDEFKNFLQYNSDQSQSSISLKLLNMINDIGEKEINSMKQKTKLVYIGAVTLAGISTILLFVFLMRTYSEYLQYFSLLFKIGQQFLYKRVYEMKYILKQIQLIRHFNDTKCQFLSSYEVSFQTPKGSQKDKYLLNLSQFQNIVEIDESKNIFEVKKFEQKYAFLSILLSKKKVIFVLLLCSALLITCGVLIGTSTSMLLDNSVKYQEIVKLGEETRRGFLYMLLANWINFLNDNSVQVQISNSGYYFEKISRWIQEKKMIDILIQSLKQGNLRTTENIPICTLLANSKHNQTTLQQCKVDLNAFSDIGISQLVTILIKNLNQLWRKNIWNNQENADGSKLCEDTRNFIYYLQPTIQTFWQILIQSLNTQIYSSISIYLIVLCAGSAVFFLLLLNELLKTYLNLTNIVKFEVFTLDTPQDLYNYSEFKPYLNRMLYRDFDSFS